MYRAATDEDCQCAGSLAEMRNGYGGIAKPVPKHDPYAVSGDFNGDSAQDFAIVLVDSSKRRNQFVLAVFNGPYSRNTLQPAFVRAGLDLRGQGLFFYDDDPSLKPYCLVLGAFASEGQIIRPVGKSYSLK